MSIRLLLRRANASTWAVNVGPRRCELCLGTLTLMLLTVPLLGDMTVAVLCTVLLALVEDEQALHWPLAG